MVFDELATEARDHDAADLDLLSTLELVRQMAAPDGRTPSCTATPSDGGARLESANGSLRLELGRPRIEIHDRSRPKTIQRSP